jgi:hypothetical protein
METLTRPGEHALTNRAAAILPPHPHRQFSDEDSLMRKVALPPLALLFVVSV